MKFKLPEVCVRFKLSAKKWQIANHQNIADMRNKYESKRLTISYPALEKLCLAYNLPPDAPTQALASYIEKLIFEALSQPVNK